jgi:hypothetical protein
LYRDPSHKLARPLEVYRFMHQHELTVSITSYGEGLKEERKEGGDEEVQDVREGETATSVNKEQQEWELEVV